MSDSTPKFSVIIPTRARPAQLSACLESLRQLEFSRGKFEVIVVDDGSPIPLPKRSDDARSCIGGHEVVLLRIAHAGPAAARNAGAKIARGRFIAFTDDDCVVETNWLTSMESRLCEDPEQMIGGPVINRLIDNTYAVTSQIILDSVYAHYNADPCSASFFASNNMAMSAELFHQIGGFDAGFPRAAAEDRDICNRWRHAGLRMTYAPEALVYHGHELTFRSFCRQHFNYGCGAWEYHARRSRRGSGRLRNDLSFHNHLLGLLKPSFSKLKRRQKMSVAGLLAVWQTANAVGFLWQGMRASRYAMRARHGVEEVSASARAKAASQR
jgi:GT2 family glycosyltransferase